MTSSIVIPSRPSVGAYSDVIADAMVAEKSDYDARVADALVDVATAAAADIEALQAGTSNTGVNGTTIAAGGSLTTGQVLRATGAAAAAWGAVDLADTDAVTGVLPGANVAAAVAGVSAGVVTAADQTHINSTPTFQRATGTLVTGTATINTGIVIGATSECIAYPDGAITGSTNFGSLQELRASRVNGGAGVGTIVIQAIGNDGLIDADAAGAFHVSIFTPHA